MNGFLARVTVIAAAAAAPLAATSLFASGCGSTTTEPTAGTGGNGGNGTGASTGTTLPPDAGPVVTVLHPEAEPLPGQSKCEVTITTGIAIENAAHVGACTEVEYATNPPSGGSHWGSPWASYLEYDVPVPREMYVHSMEHGAVVLLHNCKDACPDVLETLKEAREVLQGDPKCLMIPGGPTERVVTTPDPELDVPLAAAAWGATYKATCLDPKSLEDFVKKVYDKAPESLCNGSGPIPVCVDGGPSDAGSDAASGSGGAGGSGGGGAGGAGGDGG